MIWYEDKVSTIVIGGVHSPNEILETVFSKARRSGHICGFCFMPTQESPSTRRGFTEMVFADYVDCWKPFVITRDQIHPAQVATFAALKESQHEVHLWGEANRVVFDPAKGVITLTPPKVGNLRKV